MFVPGDVSGQGHRHQDVYPRVGTGAVPSLLREEGAGAGGEPVLQQVPGQDPEAAQVSGLMQLAATTFSAISGSLLENAKPQEFKARLEKRNESKNEVLGHSKQAEFVRFMEHELEKRDKMAAEDGASGGFTKNKTLGSILNMEMIRDKTGEEIAELWMGYYSTKDTVSAVIPAQIYELIFSRSQSCQTFLYALPQQEGYEFFLGQWSGHELHFTSLINVQTMGENAPSQMILYHYPELKEEKGVVLMTAEMDPKFITVHQAQCLANQVQLFYGTQRQETYRLVETFNHHPTDFKHMLVIAELEQSGLGPAVSPGGS
ncbi:ATP synthase mitochondrial F1 complex assembly factor 1 isoform X1 [Pagrus major]|uniref:ATP synthase mitochondrial F1 complex assembly factor 1 isoform X1 n=1 Tax=Pagrus major TaxID=143350 RepID=UPI003CC8E1C2